MADISGKQNWKQLGWSHPPQPTQDRSNIKELVSSYKLSCRVEAVRGNQKRSGSSEVFYREPTHLYILIPAQQPGSVVPCAQELRA